jgi:hypothetical protein
MLAEAPPIMASCEPGLLARWAERCRAFGLPHVLLHDRLFMRKGHRITPEGTQGVELTGRECEALLDALGGWMVQWTTGIDPAQDPGEWYSVICRKARPLEARCHSERNGIRHGLRECAVRRISVETLADAGYPVYAAAWKGYGCSTVPLDEAAFRHGVLREAPFPDLLHNWGVYAHGRLVAYAQNQIHDGAEVEYSVVKLDPEALRLRPSFALFHTMNEFYLGTMGYTFVTAGTRSISHQTNIQDFLMRHFGFEKAYTKLKVHYRQPLRGLVRLCYPFRSNLGRLNGQIRSLLELERCRRESGARSAERGPARNSPVNVEGLGAGHFDESITGGVGRH